MIDRIEMDSLTLLENDPAVNANEDATVNDTTALFIPVEQRSERRQSCPTGTRIHQRRKRQEMKGNEQVRQDGRSVDESGYG